MRNLKRTGSPNLSLNIEMASATIVWPGGSEHIRDRTWSWSRSNKKLEFMQIHHKQPQPISSTSRRR